MSRSVSLRVRRMWLEQGVWLVCTKMDALSCMLIGVLFCTSTCRVAAQQAAAPVATAAGIKVPVSRDAWISGYPTEVAGNNGGSPRLKLKGNQEFFLIDFDPQSLDVRGRQVAKAELHLHAESPEGIGRVTVSSIADSWVEGITASYEEAPGVSSFHWAENGVRRWRGDGPDITGVILGNGGSVWGFADALRVAPNPQQNNSSGDAQPWFVVPIAAEVVQARLDGRSQGFFVMDDVGSEYSRQGNTIDYRLLPNRFFSSRERNATYAPYFVLWFAEGSEDSAENTALTAEETADRRDSSSTETRPVEAILPAKIEHVQGSGAKPSQLDAGKPATQITLLDLFHRPLVEPRLFAAKGEAIWIQIPAGAKEQGEWQIEVPAGIEVQQYLQPQVAGMRDPLVPVDHPALNTIENADSGYRLVEFYVSPQAKAGDYSIAISSSQPEPGQATTQLVLTIWDFALPDQLSFLPQMNCYGLPEDELAYYQLAHQHRTVLNQLRYGWSGKVQQGAVPRRFKVEKGDSESPGEIGLSDPQSREQPHGQSNEKWDWEAWDAKFGPLLSGTAFAGLRRDSIPIEAFYLPLNENWPMDHERAFRGGYWIEGAYDEGYWAEFRDTAHEFAQHIAQRQWTETMFEFYLNNKVYFKRDRGNRWDACSAAWIFDEPVNTQDFWALRRFGAEFWQGVAPVTGPRFTFRADISQPQWQRDLLDGVTSVEVVSGNLRSYQKRVMDRARRHDNLVYMYGSANPIGSANAMPVLWSVESWALGADGVVPWQTIGTKESWQTPDTLSLFYPTSAGPVPSLRLKAFQAGQQLVEYLTIYAALSGQDRQALGQQVLAEYGFSGEMVKQSESDAGTSVFEAGAVQRLDDLRSRLGHWLNEKQPESRARWHDPRPPVRRPTEIVPREVVRE